MDQRISQFPATTTPLIGDYLPIVHDNQTNKVAVEDLLRFALRAIPKVAGRYYGGDLVGNNFNAGSALSTNTLYGCHIILPERKTLAALATRITTAIDGAKVRMGLYEVDLSTMLPTTLVAGTDAAEVTLVGVGAQDAATTPSVAIEPGIYCLAFITNQAISAPVSSTSASEPGLGFASPSASVNAAPGLRVSSAFTYAALPSTWPSPAIAVSGAVATLYTVS